MAPRPATTKGRKARRGRKTSTLRGRRRARNKRARTRKIYSSHSVFNVPLIVPKNIQEVRFNTYIKKVLKRVKPHLNINRESVTIMDNLMKDTLHQIATHASSKMGRRKVLKPKILMRALRKIMPRSLVEKADEHGQRALDRYMSKSRRR